MAITVIKVELLRHHIFFGLLPLYPMQIGRLCLEILNRNHPKPYVLTVPQMSNILN